MHVLLFHFLIHLIKLTQVQRFLKPFDEELGYKFDYTVKYANCKTEVQLLNAFLTLLVCKTVKEKIPKAPIYIWSGYTYEHLKHTGDPHVRGVLEIADYLIDGPYIQELRDVTLPMRGSSNQNIYQKWIFILRHLIGKLKKREK